MSQKHGLQILKSGMTIKKHVGSPDSKVFSTRHRTEHGLVHTGATWNGESPNIVMNPAQRPKTGEITKNIRGSGWDRESRHVAGWDSNASRIRGEIKIGSKLGRGLETKIGKLEINFVT